MTNHKSPYEFTFRCPNCHKEPTLAEKFEPGRAYVCPACKKQVTLQNPDVRSKTTLHPFTFMCPKCDTVQRTHDIDYLGDVNGYYTTKCRCPGCGRHLTFREETTLHYLLRTRPRKD